MSLRRVACCRRLVPRSDAGRPACSAGAFAANLSRAALLTLIAHKHLVLQVFPDLFVDLDEARVEADLCDVARSRQVHLVSALHRARACGEDEYPVAKRDGLLEVV